MAKYSLRLIKKGPRYERKPLAEINVVPYIDVMLVLLVIFMATAPFLTQGLHLKLPTAAAKKLPTSTIPPIIVTINSKGYYYLKSNNDPLQKINLDELKLKIMALLETHKNTPVYIQGDTTVNYGKVVEALALLQKEGVTRVSLITQPYVEHETK